MPDKNTDDLQEKVVLSPLVEADNGVWERIKRLIGSKTQTVGGFKLIDDSRWVAWYSNAFGPDKDDEFISTKALENDVKRMNDTGEYPELWFFHMRGSKHGKADAVGAIGRFAVATGTFDDTPIAQVFKTFYKSNEGKIAMSFGFDYEPSRKVKGTYYDVRAFEVSTVTPARFAANPYTVFDVYGMENDMEPQLDSLQKVFEEHPELLQQIVTETEDASKSLEETQGYKALIEHLRSEVDETPPVEEKADDVPDTMNRDEVAELIDGRFKMFEANLKGMFSDYVTEMEKRFTPKEQEKSTHDPLAMKMIAEIEQRIKDENREIKSSELTPLQTIEMMNLGGKEVWERTHNIKVVD